MILPNFAVAWIGRTAVVLIVKLSALFLVCLLIICLYEEGKFEEVKNLKEKCFVKHAVTDINDLGKLVPFVYLNTKQIEHACVRI